jgi:hypothetical protein
MCTRAWCVGFYTGVNVIVNLFVWDAASMKSSLIEILLKLNDEEKTTTGLG